MSFGTSAGDFVLILQLAWNTFQGAKQACGEYDELTREVANLHKVLERVQEEVARSTTSGENAERRTELDEAVVGCEHILRVMDQVLRKYNALGEDKKKGKRLWQKIKFGNGEMKDLSEIRLKLSTHTTAIMMNLKLYTLGSLGRIEDKLNNQGGDLEGIRESINWIAANMTASSSAKAQGSVWTTYENDDKVFWRELRRQLHREGFSKAALERKKSLLTGYVEELGHRGVFDEDEGSGNNVENAKTAAKNLASHDKHLGVIIEVGEGIEEYRSATDNQDPDITDEGSETESLSSTASSYEYLEPVGASMTSKKSEIEELRPPCPRPVGIADNTVADSTAARSTVYNEANSLRMSTDKKHRSDSRYGQRPMCEPSLLTYVIAQYCRRLWKRTQYAILPHRSTRFLSLLQRNKNLTLLIRVIHLRVHHRICHPENL